MSSDNEQRRETIFNRYAGHLQVLAKEGIVNPAFAGKNLYICPMCLAEFPSPNEGDNPLTLEDAPPKSLGGKAHVLTCKKCNNTAGSKIDFHLAERLNEIDSKKFLPGTELKVKIKIGAETFRATLSVDERGTMTVHHSNKNNHPEKLAEAMAEVKAGMTLNPEFFLSRVIPENLEYALLKTGYLIAFRKYGYSFLLDHCFDTVRQQLQDPETPVYPSGFWFYLPETVPLGAFFIMDKGYESLFVVFSVTTGKSTHRFGTVLPLPVRPIEQVIERITEKFQEEKEFPVTLYPLEQDTADYLTNLENIKAAVKWIYERKAAAKAES